MSQDRRSFLRGVGALVVAAAAPIGRAAAPVARWVGQRFVFHNNIVTGATGPIEIILSGGRTAHIAGNVVKGGGSIIIRTVK